MSAFPTEPALEAAVVAHADEDTPRLVYADWLDEHGDPDRAAFIRVQCRLADLPPDDPDWCALDVRQDELARRLTPRLGTLGQRLPKPLDPPNGPARHALTRAFRRGFPAVAVYYGLSSSPQPRQAVVAVADLVATTTCRDLDLHWLPPEWLEALAAEPAAEHLRGLSLTFPPGWGDPHTAVRTATLLKLVESPVARNLHRIELDKLPASAAQPLAASSGFPALRQFSSHDSGTPPDLLAAPWLRGLHHLRLREYGASEATLTAAGELPELHTLEINPLARPEHLAAAHFPRLVRLTNAGVRMLLRDFQVLLAAPWLARLHSLDVSSADLGDRAVVALARHPVARNLRDLRIGSNPFGRIGLNALAEPGAFPELVRLDLSLGHANKRKATEADVVGFLKRLACPRLQALHLTGLPVGDDGARAIADNPALGELRELHLGDGVSERGRNALRACEHLRQTTIM